jgi:hypothetical protein
VLDARTVTDVFPVKAEDEPPLPPQPEVKADTSAKAKAKRIEKTREQGWQVIWEAVEVMDSPFLRGALWLVVFALTAKHKRACSVGGYGIVPNPGGNVGKAGGCNAGGCVAR